MNSVEKGCIKMENLIEKVSRNGVSDNGNHNSRPGSKNGFLSWLDLRVFYLRISKCEIDSSTPEYLTLNHVPLNYDTLLELNGVRKRIYSDGVSTLLRRDRIDKKSEEITFVSTDTISVTGSMKFEVLYDEVPVISGVLDFCTSNCKVFSGDSRIISPSWSMSCESDMVRGSGFFKGCPEIEVYVAGSFSGSPFILTKTLQLGQRRKQIRKSMLEPIPEYEAAENQNENSSGPQMQLQVVENQEHKAENEDYMINHQVMEYLYGEDEELSWFNAGVRVGVGIGLSVCVGLGIGVGLLVKTYQGTMRNFTRRLL